MHSAVNMIALKLHSDKNLSFQQEIHHFFEAFKLHVLEKLQISENAQSAQISKFERKLEIANTSLQDGVFQQFTNSLSKMEKKCMKTFKQMLPLLTPGFQI